MSDIRVTDVRAIETAPMRGSNLIVVRIDTNQPGLYGLGCATFTQRHKAVVTAIEVYMKQLLVGRDATNVQDNFQVMMNSSYWRNGPVLNNAISGCDMAFWDILGKELGAPVWKLWGGKCRDAVSVYRHADGRDFGQLDEKIHSFLEQGYQYIRCQFGGYGGKTRYLNSPEGTREGTYFDALSYMRGVPKLFEHVRGTFGEEVELLHDVHERLTPVDAMWLVKQLEQYRLFFLEDALSPEQGHWWPKLRDAAAVPLAMGELFNNPMEWIPLIENRWIDYIRCHISQIGGATPARALAAQCELFGVRTAWHGPGDVSPIGHMANVHLDLTTPNFGIQEWCGMEQDPRVQEVFQGCAEIKGGMAWANDKPGWGIEIDEKAAAKYPCDSSQPAWLLSRLPDGTSVKA
ncbi:MAG: starvation-sensing protein RspA [Oscillospiraceae bacterium]|jgi:mannonate dehydratase|nr:starvation-sensing protein RspA [Oscillospiraceae bacterium]